MGESNALSFGLTIDDEACSTCSLCVYVCPFEAISVKQLDEERKVEVDESKCRFCGLCYSICPLEAIRIAYYSFDELAEQAKKLCHENGSRSLVVACRGSNPTETGTIGGTSYGKLPVLKVPCVGRVPLEFYAKLLSDDTVDGFHVLPCEEDFCRLEEGGRMSILRVEYLRDLLGELQVDSELLNVVRCVNKAKVDEFKCIGCGNCAHYCPYEAASVRSPGIASIDEKKCKGCGICLAYCPNFCIVLEGYKHEDLANIVTKLLEKVEEPAPIAVFYCQWAYTPKTHGSGSNLCFIELPCAGRADPFHIVQALGLGFSGILVLACEQDMCNFEEMGARRAKENLGNLKRLLGQLGLEEKVGIAFASMKHPGEADQALSSFTCKIREGVNET